MGVLNLTPDSFSDGGLHTGRGVVEHALAMAEQGALVVDVGGESTRPGAERVSEAEQIARVVEPIRAVRAALDEAGHPGVWVSIDTTRAAVAQAALAAGACWVNDVSAGREDAGMLALVAERRVPVCLMHMQGQPGTMQQDPRYGDVVTEVLAFLEERALAAEQAGVPSDQIVIDPGIGFGKTLEHNLQLLAAMDRFVATGRPVLLGASRKRFIQACSPETGQLATDRVGGTVGVTALAVQAGVQVIRVHDVAANVQAGAVVRAIENARSSRSTNTNV